MKADPILNLAETVAQERKTMEALNALVPVLQSMEASIQQALKVLAVLADSLAEDLGEEEEKEEQVPEGLEDCSCNYCRLERIYQAIWGKED